ncbi:tail fiber domain-containing protein [Portibacter lacus]|uniref:Peptidase S74 domain-containing protein n=1 Tax=Portibacter lacus TaxID=1099794 RepID=A0AA37SU42_9BACT|nr:tail fiber domain-containing protein [Portibacter lacus]GLR18183.1 hypothetical protein GCM10007940_27980 [Portibacter lacus]
MKAILYTIILIFISIISLIGQNVGIGTSNPSAKLHVKGDNNTISIKNEGFNEGVIPPSYLMGDQNWQINNVEFYDGNYSAQAPTKLLTDEEAVIEITLNTPVGKDIRVNFAYKHDHSNNEVKFEIFTPSESKEIGHTLTWKIGSSSFIASSSQSIIYFKLSGLKDSQNAETYLDQIMVTYHSDPAFKIEDGTQMSGGILQSDAQGNTSWVDLRSEIDQQVGDATQTLLFRTTNNKLDISNGNQVRILALSNDSGKSLKMNENSLDLTTGTSFTIGSAVSTIGYFQYEGGNGHLSWGKDRSEHTPTGKYTTRWGFENRPNGDYSTTWGYGNTSDQNSSFGTLWGKENLVSGHFATAWGSNNTVSADSLSTAWGTRNKVSGYNSTTWGNNNNLRDSLTTSWGNGNFLTGAYATAWGDDNSVSGRAATATGYRSSAEGNYSMAIGAHARAHSFGELALGRYNATGGSETEWMADDNAFSIGNGNSSLFGANNAFVIKKDGKTGINRNSPEYALDISLNDTGKGIRIGNYDFSRGNGTFLVLEGYNQAIRFQNQGEWGFSLNYSPDDNVFTILDEYDHVMTVDNGKIGFGNYAPERLLHLGSDSAMKPGTSTWEVPSDGRLKRDIKPFNQGLKSIQQINPVWFTYTGAAGIPEGTTVGTVAQDLEKVAPFMVSEWDHVDEHKRSTTYKSVNYHSLSFMLVNAVKEQQEQIEQLMKIVEMQGKQIKALQEAQQNSLAIK